MLGKNFKDAVTNVAGFGILVGTLLVLGVKYKFLAKQLEDIGLMLGGGGSAIVSYFTGKPNNFKFSSSEEDSRPTGASDAVEGE
ncbi:MAG: hypothetical protein ACRCZS_16250 [Chroococcidiopsis sp.]